MRLTAIALVLVLAGCGEQRPPAPTPEQNDQLNEAEDMLNEEVGSSCRDQPPPWDEADLHLKAVEKISAGADGQLAWNDQAISTDELVARLNEPQWTGGHLIAVAFERSPDLSCDQIERVRSLMNATKACQQGKCAEVEPPPQ